MAGTSAPDFDLAVIGSGGAAFAAAIQATRLGKTVLMVERSTVGGTCVNTGCIPSKFLLAAAEARHAAADGPDRFPGISSCAGALDMAVLLESKATLVGAMRADKYENLISGYGWNLLVGDAVFAGSPEQPVLSITAADGGAHRVTASRYLVATGSVPRVPLIPGLSGTDYLTSTTAMELEKVPESLLVVGGGYVALEQAQLFSRLGSQVTMLVRSRLAPGEEPEAAHILRKVFADEGIRVVEGADLVSVRTDAKTGRVLATANTKAGQMDYGPARLLMATGRRAATTELNLEAVAARTGSAGEILVDSTLATSNPRIWAAGDVTGHRQFVYVAAAHGALAVDNAFTGAGREVDYRHLPRVAFTSPALAGVGLTEEEAAAAGIRCDCRVLALDHVPRALVNRDTRGFIKIVAEHGTGRILGISAVAREAGDLAAAGVYIIEAGMTVTQVAGLWAPYLTMAEGIKIAAQSYTTDPARLSCCAA